MPKSKSATRRAKPPVRKVSSKKPKAKTNSPASRLTGLPAQLTRLAKPLLSRRSPVLTILKEEGLTPQFTLRLAKALENTLRTKMSTSPSQTLADLIHEARKQEVISEEAFHLANRLRHQRNSVAHDHANPKTLAAQTLMVFSTAVLLFYQLESN